MRDIWLTQPLTCVLRKDALNECLNNKYIYFRDNHLFYHIIKKGKGFYFTQVFGVYRKHPGGIFSMWFGHENYNIEYNCYKEIFENNNDDFTRYMYFKHIKRLLDYNLSYSYEGNTYKKRIRLLLDAFSHAHGLKEYSVVTKLLIKFILPKGTKNRVKHIFRRSK